MKRSRAAFCGVHIIFFLAATGSWALAEAPKSGAGHQGKAFDDHYRGCIEWNDGRACTNLGTMYAEGQVVTKDDVKAAEYYEKGCKYKDPRGCTALALACVSGVGVTKDLAKAAELFEKGCKYNDPRGCTNLGFLYTTGQGVAKDEAKAIQLFQQGCDGGNVGGCNNILAYHVSGCQAGDGQRCLEGGRWVQAMLQKKDLPEGAQLDQTLVPRFTTEAARLLELACSSRKAQGCADLASMYSKGEGVAQDKPKAAELYKQACDIGLATACGKQ